MKVGMHAAIADFKVGSLEVIRVGRVRFLSGAGTCAAGVLGMLEHLA